MSSQMIGEAQQYIGDYLEENIPLSQLYLTLDGQFLVLIFEEEYDDTFYQLYQHVLKIKNYNNSKERYRFQWIDRTKETIYFKFSLDSQFMVFYIEKCINTVNLTNNKHYRLQIIFDTILLIDEKNILYFTNQCTLYSLQLDNQHLIRFTFEGFHSIRGIVRTDCLIIRDKMLKFYKLYNMKLNKVILSWKSGDQFVFVCKKVFVLQCTGYSKLQLIFVPKTKLIRKLAYNTFQYHLDIRNNPTLLELVLLNNKRMTERIYKFDIITGIRNKLFKKIVKSKEIQLIKLNLDLHIVQNKDSSFIRYLTTF